MTNFERIKNLTPDELAEFLGSVVTDEGSEEYKKWLEEEYIDESEDVKILTLTQARDVLSNYWLSIISEMSDEEINNADNNFKKLALAHSMAIRSFNAWDEFAKWIGTHFPWNEDEKLVQKIKDIITHIMGVDDK